jgi:hypothetical protein
MPVYDVNNVNAQKLAWNLQVGPPGMPGARPGALLQLNGPGQNVPMGQQMNVALNAQCTAIYTQHLTDCSAFCILYRQGAAAWSRASLIHMMGGPDPNSVNWAGMVNQMPNNAGAVYFAILANSKPTVLTQGFLAAVQQNLPQIPNNNLWVYNQNLGAINFGVDWGAFAGEP